MSKFLLASDGSQYSLRAARYLGELVRQMEDVTVTVVHVTHVPHPLHGPAGRRPLTQLPLAGLLHQTADPVVRSTLAALDLPSERRESVVLAGEPAEEIVEYARQEGVDMIVMGRRGLGRLGEPTLGSVSYRVVHHSPCRVLVV